MSIFSAIIEAVTGHIQDPSDYEYEGDDLEDDDSESDDDDDFMNKWRSIFGYVDEQGELKTDGDD